MIKIKKLRFDIGEEILYVNKPATVTGYIQYNEMFFYILVRDGEERSFEADECFMIRKEKTNEAVHSV